MNKNTAKIISGKPDLRLNETLIFDEADTKLPEIQNLFNASDLKGLSGNSNKLYARPSTNPDKIFEPSSDLEEAMDTALKNIDFDGIFEDSMTMMNIITPVEMSSLLDEDEEITRENSMA